MFTLPLISTVTHFHFIEQLIILLLEYFCHNLRSEGKGKNTEIKKLEGGEGGVTDALL